MFESIRGYGNRALGGNWIERSHVKHGEVVLFTISLRTQREFDYDLQLGLDPERDTLLLPYEDFIFGKVLGYGPRRWVSGYHRKVNSAVAFNLQKPMKLCAEGGKLVSCKPAELRDYSFTLSSDNYPHYSQFRFACGRERVNELLRELGSDIELVLGEQKLAYPDAS